jgi:serine/threonine protein kinase
LDVVLFDKHQQMTYEEILKLIRGIAAGMCHLHKRNIVHRDLAARNILLTSEGDPKISVGNFFLSVELMFQLFIVFEYCLRILACHEFFNTTLKLKFENPQHSILF